VTVLGIDPGKSGGLAVIDSNGQAHTWPMPPTLPDLWALFERIRDQFGPVDVEMEDVSSSSQQGAKSIWTFSGNFHALRMACVAMKWKTHREKPLAILKATGCHVTPKPLPPKAPKGASDEAKKAANKARTKATNQKQRVQKNRTRELMLERWPHVKTNGTQGLTLKVADALMIAEYGRARRASA